MSPRSKSPKTIISFALMVAAFLVATAEAQETQIGNGRLLRKFRDDVFGAPNQQKGNAQNKNAQQPTPAQMQSRQAQSQSNQNLNPQINQNQANQNQNRSGGLFRSPQFSAQSASNQNQRQPNQRTPQQQVQQSTQQRQQSSRQPQPQQHAQHHSSRNQNGSINRNDPRYRGQAQNQQRPQGQIADNANQSTQNQTQLDYYRRKGSPSNLTIPRNLASQPPQQQAPTPVPSQTFEPQPAPPQTYADAQSIENRAMDKAATLAKAKRRGPQSAGFGLELNIDKEEQIYVADLDRKGNAAKAGLKKGDIVLEIGGAKLGSVEEFDEIAKVMKDGDQLELKISRRGRTSVVSLQFGEASEPPANSQGAPADNIVSGSQTTPSNDFVPGSEVNNGVTLESGVEEAPSPPVSIDRPELPEIDLEIDQPNSVLDLDSDR